MKQLGIPDSVIEAIVPKAPVMYFVEVNSRTFKVSSNKGLGDVFAQIERYYDWGDEDPMPGLKIFIEEWDDALNCMVDVILLK